MTQSSFCGCGLVEEKPVDAATPAEKVPVTADVIAEIKDTIADVATEGYKKQELPTFFMVGGGELSNTLAQILRATSLAKFSKDQKQENMDAIFFKADDDKLTIAAYCKRFAVQATTQIDGGNGEFVLANKSAEKIAKAIPYSNFEDVEATLKGRNANFNLGYGVNLNFPTLATQFDAIQFGTQEYSKVIVLTQNKLKSLLNQTLFAAADDIHCRPIFNTVNFRYQNGVLTLKASDTRQLATAQANKISGTDNFECSVFIDALKFILPLLDGDDDITITESNYSVNFAFGNWCVKASRFDRITYPDFSSVLSAEKSVAVTIENCEECTGRKALLNAIKFVAPLMDDDNSVELVFEQKRLTIQSARQGIGSARVSLEILSEGLDHGEARGRFNVKRLINAISHAEDTNVDIELSKNTLTIGEENSNAIFVMTAINNRVELPKKELLVLENVA